MLAPFAYPRIQINKSFVASVPNNIICLLPYLVRVSVHGGDYSIKMNGKNDLSDSATTITTLTHGPV